MIYRSFKFETNWEMNEEAWQGLFDQARLFAKNHQLSKVSIEKSIYNNRVRFQVFTTKNYHCRPASTVDDAYAMALECANV